MRHALPVLALLPLVLAAPAGARLGARPAQLHARQRPDGGGDRGPPRAGRHPDGLVPGRVGGRAGRASPGIAHFLEHLMFKATDELEDGEFSRIVAENGGTDNAFTSTDYTGYFQRIAADRLDLVMGMEADRMVDLAPTEAGVRSERDVVLEERRQVVESDPSGPYNEAAPRRALPQPPLRPAGDRLGARDRGADPARARSTSTATHYAPNNAILVVAGDVDAAAVRAARREALRPDPGLGGDRRRGCARRSRRTAPRAGSRCVTRGCASRRSAAPISRRSAAPATRRRPPRSTCWRSCSAARR